MPRGLVRRNIGFPKCDFPKCENLAKEVHYITVSGGNNLRKFHLCSDHHRVVHSKDGRKAEDFLRLMTTPPITEEKVIFT